MKKQLVLLYLLIMISLLAGLTEAAYIKNFQGEATEIITINIFNLSTNQKNITFDQKPYILNANMFVNTSNITNLWNSSIASSNTINTDGQCVSGSATSGWINNTYNLIIDYRIEPANISIDYENINLPASYTQIDCRDTITGSWVIMFYDSTAGRYQTDVLVNDSCIDSNNQAQIRAILVRGQTTGTQCLHSMSDIEGVGNQQITTENDVIVNTTNSTSINAVFDFTTEAKNNVNDSVLFFEFGGRADYDIITNITIEYIYTKSINVSVLSNLTLELLNPTCTYNTETVYPYSELINFNSSLENILRCSLPGYTSITKTITPESDYFNVSMITSVLNLSIYDEETGEPYNGTTELSFISNTYADNRTVTGSLVNLTTLPPELYEIRYYSQGYTIRSYFHYVNESADLELYVLNESVAETQTFIVEDETGNLLEGAIVKLQRGYIIGNLQVFKTVEMDKSNYNGFSVFSKDPNAKYRVIVEYENITVFSSSEDYKLSEDVYTITANLLADPTEGFFASRNIYTSLEKTATNTSITYTVNDPSNYVASFCLEVVVLNSLNTAGYTSICDSCLSADSGSIACNITSYRNDEVEILAKGKIIGTDNFQDYTNIKSYIMRKKGKESLGLIGVFLGSFVIATFFFAGLYLFGLVGAIIGLDLGFIICAATGMIVIPTSLLITIIVVLTGFIILVSD